MRSGPLAGELGEVQRAHASCSPRLTVTGYLPRLKLIPLLQGTSIYAQLPGDLVVRQCAVAAIEVLCPKQ